MSKGSIPGDVLFVLIVLAVLCVRKLWGSFNERRSHPKKPDMTHRGFGINYMMRRRRLNVFNKDSSFRTTPLSKMTKQRKGLMKRQRRIVR